MPGGMTAPCIHRHVHSTSTLMHRCLDVLVVAWLLCANRAGSGNQSEAAGFFVVAAHNIDEEHGKLDGNHGPRSLVAEGRHDIFRRNGNRGNGTRGFHGFNLDRNDTESSESDMDWWCGAETAPDAVITENTRKRRNWWRRRNHSHGGGQRGLQAAVPTVYVNLNIIVIQTTAGVGYLSSAQIQSQINVLNLYYWPQFQFQLLNTPASTIYYHTSDTDYYCTKPLANVFKPLLRKGGADTLNVYLCDSPSFGGWGTFPWNGASSGIDGIVVHVGTIPGGFIEGMNEGKVSLIFEVLARFKCFFSGDFEH
jgi:hypothetical protein